MDDRGWMIEIDGTVNSGRTVWWTGRAWSFSPDPNKGVRFCRKQDAEAVLALLVKEGLREPCIVTEHVWMAPATEGPQRP